MQHRKLINLLFYPILIILISIKTTNEVEVNCSELKMMGQYICPHPGIKHIDPKTQELKGCTKENRAKGMYANPSIINCQY